MATKSYKIVGRQLWQLSVFDEIQRVDCANMSTENKCISRYYSFYNIYMSVEKEDKGIHVSVKKTMIDAICVSGKQGTYFCKFL